MISGCRDTNGMGYHTLCPSASVDSSGHVQRDATLGTIGNTEQPQSMQEGNSPIPAWLRLCLHVSTEHEMRTGRFRAPGALPKFSPSTDLATSADGLSPVGDVGQLTSSAPWHDAP
eukprot:scaffold49620_cov41-Tisochrysis_lutea.AAC.2